MTATLTAPAQRRRREEQGGKFRVLTGAHLGKGPEGCECPGCTSPDPALAGTNHAYESYPLYRDRRMREKRKDPYDVEPILTPEEYTGDVISTDVDLIRRFNREPNPQFRKFERVDGERDYGAAPEPYPLDRMTVDQLFTVAHASGIDTKGIRSQEALLAKIKEHRGYAAVGGATGGSDD